MSFAECHCAECHYAECHLLNVITLNAITLIVAALIREIVTIRECFELTRGLYCKTFYGRNLRISVIS